MQPTLTRRQIDGFLKTANEKQAELKTEAENLALSALAGDVRANKRLLELDVEREAVEDRIRLLTDARTEALRVEAAGGIEARRAELARYTEDARAQAREVIASADRVEQLVDEINEIVAKLGALQGSIRRSLNGANLPHDGRIGQTDFVAQVMTEVSGIGRTIRPDRRVGEVMRLAWRELLADDTKGD